MSKYKTSRRARRKSGRKFGKGGNREYKSDVFSMLLEDKKNALEVYNALNHSGYTDPEAVEIITTDHGISLSIRNDASFLIDRHINYYEHQASFNPNMPLRCLIYYVNDIQNNVKYTKEDLYGYSVFVDKVRKNLATKELSVAIKFAIDECIAEDIQKDFFITRRDEVEKVTKLDFTFETREKMIHRDAKAEGRDEAIEELQPQIDALKEDNNALREENHLLNDENARLRKALAEAGLSAD